MPTIEFSGRGAGRRVSIVVAKFNDFVTDRLLAGALAALDRAGVGADAVTIVRVPGAFEIPIAAQHAAKSGRFDAVVCLGCLIRGETPPRRIYWADVDRVRELHGPAYQLSLRHLLPGPYLPHTLVRGETVLEVLARPGMRVVLRQALVDGYDSLKEDVLRLISKTAEVDLHGRWWRE